MLCSIDEQDAPEARLALTLLCVSDRPLTVEELIGALAIDVSKWQLDREGRSFSQDHLLDICLGLIELAVVENEYSGEVSTIARIAHFSVQEYLKSDRISQQGAAKFAVQEELAETEMARVCLVYLLDPTLSDVESNEAMLEMFPLADFAAMEWSYFYKNSGKGKSDIKPLVLRLFMDQPESFVTWVRVHDIDIGSPPMDLKRENIPPPLYYAIFLRLEFVFTAIIASFTEKITIDATLNTQEVVHEDVAQTMLDCRVGVNAQGGYYGNALQAASCGLFGDSVEEEYHQWEAVEKMMQTLLDHGADVNAQGGIYGNALQAASYAGRERAVQTLLDHGADVNAYGGVYQTVLQAASNPGHEALVRILLDRGADVNAREGTDASALEVASYYGHEKVVQILLDRGANINRDDEYANALVFASYGGREKVVQMLLDRGSDVYVQEDLCKALEAASREGKEQVVQILLDRGADIDAQADGEYGNALQAASYAGQDKVVRMLLDRGADINTQGGDYGNALQAASWDGQEKVVQILLDRGADVNAQGGGNYGNALQVASYMGHEKVVQILLHHGADVSAEGGENGNALRAALQEGHEKLVQILLDNGAKPEPIV